MTGANAKIKRIMIGDKQVRPAGWTPGANTLLYIPMQTDLLDKVGTYTVTNISVTLTTLSGVKCGYFNGSARLDTTLPAFSNKKHTLCFWYKDNGSANSTPIISSNTSGYADGECFRYSSSSDLQYIVFSSSSTIATSTGLTKTNWNNIVFSGGDIYVNGVLKTTSSGTYATGHNFTVGGHAVGGSGLKYVTGYMSEVIIESSVWTSTEVANYYNNTKANYGL